jgi:hypothetical protein
MVPNLENKEAEPTNKTLILPNFGQQQLSDLVHYDDSNILYRAFF